MQSTLNNTLIGLFLGTLAVAILSLAIGPGAAVAQSGEDRAGGAVESAFEARDESPARPVRRGIRPQMAMPYFSYSRALPRSAET